MFYLSILLFSLSFLWPYHFLPLPLFYQNSFIFFSILCLLNSFKKIKIDQFSIIILVLIITIINLEYIINKNFSDSFLYFLISLIFIFFSYIVGYNYRDNNQDIKVFVTPLLLTCLLLFAIQIAQLYQINSYYIKEISPFNQRLYSNIGQPNILATIYAISIFILMQKNKTLNYIFIFIFIFGIYLTKSRVGYLSIFLISILNIINIKKLNLLSIFTCVYPLLTLSTILFINSINKLNFATENRLQNFSNGRIEIYQDAINLMNNKYFFGYGWESAYKYLPDNNTILFKSPLYSYHNIFLDLTLSYGIFITFFIFFILYLVLFKNIQKNIIIYSTFFPFLLHSLVEFPYYYWYLLMPFIFAIGYTNEFFYNKAILTLNKSIILILTLSLIVVYYFFYTEYEKISRPYLSAYYEECLPPSKSNFIFFSEAEFFIKYQCVKNSNTIIREKIVLESLNPILIKYYLKTYQTPDLEIKKYGCIKYNYFCENNFK